MNQLRRKFEASPIYARVMPFVVFCIITTLGGFMGEDWKFWLYALKVLVGAWLIWEMRSFVTEMRWAFSWEAVVVGVVIFVAWVGMDPFYPKNHILMQDTPESIWNPFARFGENSLVAWALIVIRIFGMTIIVPPLEEVFYRSFVYRYVIKYDFMKVPLRCFDGVSFVLVSVLFGAMHFQWLPGILCGMAYQWLVIRKGRLGDAMTAHAITNFLLGCYVVWKGGEAWKFF
ncbi:MAG TPA: CAAX prenyl protease-related protein [Verrucomicrobiota bacterium]|nr:CAAX prenyl protease-related protein [Verrucomicrobiota bacterium]